MSTLAIASLFARKFGRVFHFVPGHLDLTSREQWLTVEFDAMLDADSSNKQDDFRSMVEVVYGGVGAGARGSNDAKPTLPWRQPYHSNSGGKFLFNGRPRNRLFPSRRSFPVPQ